MKNKDYYLGLDLGTSSVGWAITDANYNIPKAKGKRLWGVRLFEEAETAADRRVHRSARRRNNRTKRRLKLLQILFSEEMSAIDPDFYIRLRESFYLEQDKKNLKTNSKNTLFNDPAYTDKDFHKAYPTIWHLRKAIIDEPDKKFDLRHYFLAIHHILKNRGHFLFDDVNADVMKNFPELWQNFYDLAENINIPICDTSAESVKSIIVDRTKDKPNKKKSLKDIIFLKDEEYLGATELAGLLVGSKVSLSKIFSIKSEEEYKLSFDEGVLEDKLPDIEQVIGPDNNIDLIIAAKKIFDFGILSTILKGDKFISHAMVEYYCQHKDDLADLKRLLKTDYPEHFAQLFKSRQSGEINYNAYIGKAFENVKTFKKKCSQADLNKEIVKTIEQISGLSDKAPSDIQNWLRERGVSADIYTRAKENNLLPKQKGQAKGTIPMQCHLAELNLICESLAQTYPSFAQKDPKDGLSKCEKITKLLTFRIPYYIGPLVKRKYDEDGNSVQDGKSEFSWGDEEINELIYPWNFNNLVNKDKRAQAFIRRMTNECTYLLGKDVLPKFSLDYQRYMVLSELNNLKINGVRIDDISLKQKIFTDVFENGELTGNITLKKLHKWLKDNRLIDGDFELSGIDGSFKAKLSTQTNFRRILGNDYLRFGKPKLEKVVELTTVLGEEKQMLAKKIQETLDINPETSQKLSKLSYKNWAKFSSEFLNNVRANINGTELSILEAMWETNHNLMELLSSDYDFSARKDEINAPRKLSTANITYTDIKNLYCSPAVKRTIWQALKIVKELVAIQGATPKRVFIEVTREDKADKKRTLSRRKRLLDLYKNIKNGAESDQLIRELGSREDRDLQSKKLYLYFTQMGKCAYSGDAIDIERLSTDSYDIDHIYPRQKTKDDSLACNLVLVRAEFNREKTNIYPISGDIRAKMNATWSYWAAKGLITKEKHNRLIRQTPLSDAELGDFIARQIVETSQANKVVIGILKQILPDTEIVYSKAEHISDFRHLFSNDQKDRAGNITKPGYPEFIKLRELNDLHHAKDAYLNIVVGNVYHTRFTSDPRRWISKLSPSDKEKYSINEKALFNIDNHQSSAPQNEAWRGSTTFSTVKATLTRNDILWTRMNYIESGEISDLNIVKGVAGLLPIKNDERLKNTEKYGGYNGLKGAHFSLIELNSKTGRERRLIQIPVINKGNLEQYIQTVFSGKNPKTIIPVIPLKSYLKLDGFPIHLNGRTGDRLLFTHAIQTIFEPALQTSIKRILSAVKKQKENKNYIIDPEKDRVSKETNQLVFSAFVKKLSVLKKMPGMTNPIKKLSQSESAFSELTLTDQCQVISNFQKLFTCSAESADLSKVANGAAHTGIVSVSNIVPTNTKLIHQSLTGLHETEIDLGKI